MPLFNKTKLSPRSKYNICINIVETLFLPLALVFSFISSSYFLFLIFAVLYFMQITWYVNHRANKDGIKNFADKISSLAKIKYDLANGPVNKNYLLGLLKKADESSDFHLGSQITLINELKKEYFTITNRVNYGITKDLNITID